jgi:cytidylate kinase
MLTPHSPERHVQALERAQRHWQQRRQQAGAEERPTAVTITIAREAGARGSSVAREVGARLGWPVYDHELLEAIAREMGLRVSLLESVDERRQSWILESLETFGEASFVSENKYVRHLTQILLSLGSHGECVIVGRGAAQILPARTTLRVRLVGRLEDRIKNLAEMFGLSHDDATRKVEEIDRERVHFIKDHFQKDPTDLLQYDLVLNASRWTVPACAELIVCGLRQRQQWLAEHDANAGRS